MVRAHLIISGRVQRIFFRASAQREALALQVNGWVSNLPDGSVELVAEGEENQVKKLIDWCHVGPRGAVIKEVNMTWEEYKGEFLTFSVR